MKKLLLAGTAALFLGFSVPHIALAQTAVVVSGTTCPSTAIMAVGPNQPLLETQAGALCTNSTTGGGGSGSDVSDTPTIQNASYVSGNCMGGFQTVALGTSQSVLSQIMLSSKGGLATAKQLFVFSANPSGSTCTDKSTFTLAAADVSKLLYVGQITPAAPTGTTVTQSAAATLALGIPSGGTVYVALVETATETPASTTDLVLNFSSF